MWARPSVRSSTRPTACRTGCTGHCGSSSSWATVVVALVVVLVLAAALRVPKLVVAVGGAGRGLVIGGTLYAWLATPDEETATG